MSKRSPYRLLVISVLSVLIVAAGSAGGTLRARAQSADITSDLAIQITADRSIVKVGQEVTYTVRMTNLGPDNAWFNTVIFTLPDDLLLVSMTCDLGISADTPACEYWEQPVGTTLVTTLTATPNPTTRPGTVVTTTAVAGFLDLGFVDPDLSNNAASLQVRIVGRLPHP